MKLYICIVLYYVLSMVIEKILHNRLNRKIWVLIIVLPLLILSAFRAPTVGNDTFNYYRSYMMVSQEAFFSPSQSRLELGYIFYMRLIALFGFSYLGFQIITSTFIMFSVSRFIYKYSSNMAFSFFIFITARMFFNSMNISRQFLSIAILLFSIDFIKERKFIKFTIFVLLATSIHFTSIVFFVVYPLSYIKFNAKKTILLLSLGVISAISFDKLIQIFVSVTGRYAGYLEGGYFNFEGNIAIYINLIINLLFFLVAVFTKYWRCDELEKLDEKLGLNNQFIKQGFSNENLWYIFCLLTLILSIIGLNATILSRIESYYSIFFLAFIPNVVKYIRSKELRAIVTLGIIVGLFASFIVVMVFRPYWTTVYPYVWYWDWRLSN